MELLGIDRHRQSGRVDTVRLTGTFGSGSGEREVWVEVPTAWEHALPEESGDPWLLFLTILAAVEHEDVRIEGHAVDPLLDKGVRGALDLLTSWYGPTFIRRPEIDVSTRDPAAEPAELHRQGAQFFSGGIDSLHTAMRHTKPPDRSTGARFPTDILVRVLHDVPLSEVRTDDPHLRGLKRFASATGRNFLPISTNAMVLSPRLQDAWVSASFAMTFSFIAHSLAGAIDRMVVAAGMTAKHLCPGGTHPLLLSLCSSSYFEMVSDTILSTRLEKTALVAQSREAMRTIEICDRPSEGFGDVRNCSRCRKCLRTMTALDALGARARSTTFDWSAYESDQYGRMHFDAIENWFAGDLKGLAEEMGRNDIADAISEGQRRAALRQPLNAFVQKARRSGFAQRHKPLLKVCKDMLYRQVGLRTQLDRRG